jgi:hypothetical protein
MKLVKQKWVFVHCNHCNTNTSVAVTFSEDMIKDVFQRDDKCGNMICRKSLKGSKKMEVKEVTNIDTMKGFDADEE